MSLVLILISRLVGILPLTDHPVNAGLEMPNCSHKQVAEQAT